MSLSTSPSKIKFLLDENVDKRLEKFLKKQGIDVISKQKGLSNGKLAEFSKKERRVLITNDEDFSNLEHFTKEKIFSIILLRIPQNSIKPLINSFSNLLKDAKEFEGKFITLYESKFEISS